MSVRSIVLFPDSLLSTPNTPVSLTDPDLPALIEDLWDTLYASPGVGLAAPQIGVSQRVSVIHVNRPGRKSKPVAPAHGEIVLINPKIIRRDGQQIPREGCLSVPDLLANVERAAEVSVVYEALDGTKRTLNTSGFEALAIQHEVDHLDGVLFLDRVANIKTDIFRRKTI